MHVIALGLPGLAHRLGHGDDGSAALTALRQLADGAFEGDRVVLVGEVEAALRFAAARCDGLGVAVAVAGLSEGTLHGHPLGAEAQRVRQALALVREGEVLITPAVTDLPDGVGVFEAPALVSKTLGAPMRMLRDYR